MNIKSSAYYELLKDIHSPEFTRVLKAGETIRGVYISRWFPRLTEESFNEWFKFREDVVLIHCKKTFLNHK